MISTRKKPERRRAAERRQPSSRPMSVREVAVLRGVKPHKVIAWILTEGLMAHDVSSSMSKRPMWKIYPGDLEAFFQRRLDLRRAEAAAKKGNIRKRMPSQSKRG